MSKTTFNAYEGLRISIELEQDGIAFYEGLADAVQDEKVKKLALDLADQEREHIRRFREMIDAERFDSAWSADDVQLIDDYIRTTVKPSMFPNRQVAANIANYVLNLDEALSLAIHMERMTVQYYRKLRDTCTYVTGRKALAQLVTEEMKHAADLVETRKALQQG